ncbi:hypothetical protein, partial [Staphylococcus lutrae]
MKEEAPYKITKNGKFYIDNNRSLYELPDWIEEPFPVVDNQESMDLCQEIGHSEFIRECKINCVSRVRTALLRSLFFYFPSALTLARS